MGQINLTNSKGRDATVTTETVAGGMVVQWVDESGARATPVRILRGTIDRDVDALAARAGGRDKLAELLIEGDPEIDLESYGSLLGGTSRVYVGQPVAGGPRHVVTKVEEWEVVRNPDGSERERRLRKVLSSNTNSEIPLRWTGKLMPIAEVAHRFVLASKMQITHTNGRTYDFLYGMARELEEKRALLLVGGGPKGTQPLVFQRGGSPYRGFLEGRTQGERYLLVLHLSNLELKRPERPAS